MAFSDATCATGALGRYSVRAAVRLVLADAPRVIATLPAFATSQTATFAVVAAGVARGVATAFILGLAAGVAVRRQGRARGRGVLAAAVVARVAGIAEFLAYRFLAGAVLTGSIVATRRAVRLGPLDARAIGRAAHAIVAGVILVVAIDPGACGAFPVLAAIASGATVAVGVAARAVGLGALAAGSVSATDAVIADVALCRAVFRRAAAGAVLAGVIDGARVTVVARYPVGLGGIGACAGPRVADPGLMALVLRGADDGGVDHAPAILTGPAAAATLALAGALAIRLAEQAVATGIVNLGRVGFAGRRGLVAALAGGAGRLARAGATVDRLLAVVLDRAAGIGAGLGQRLGLARR